MFINARSVHLIVATTGLHQQFEERRLSDSIKMLPIFNTQLLEGFSRETMESPCSATMFSNCHLVNVTSPVNTFQYLRLQPCITATHTEGLLTNLDINQGKKLFLCGVRENIMKQKHSGSSTSLSDIFFLISLKSCLAFFLIIFL